MGGGRSRVLPHVPNDHDRLCEMVAVAAGRSLWGVLFLGDRVCGDFGRGGRVFVEGREPGDRGNQSDLSVELRYAVGNVVSGIVLFRRIVCWILEEGGCDWNSLVASDHGMKLVNHLNLIINLFIYL